MIPWIPDGAPPYLFPPTSAAVAEPNGLLCAGGDLSAPRLIEAYRRGIFPWFNEGDPILWWSPEARTVFVPARFHISRSLKRTLRRRKFDVTVDRAFGDVMAGCAAPRAGAAGTWISDDMQTAYSALHQHGHAHSVECWMEGKLVGGVYGVGLGQMFFGESMYSATADASKVALAFLCTGPYAMVDCQLPNPHLQRLGSQTVSRFDFERFVEAKIDMPPPHLGVALERWSAKHGVWADVGDSLGAE